MTDMRFTAAFVLASTAHGTMIVNHLDRCDTPHGQTFGVGYELLDQGSYELETCQMLCKLLEGRRSHFGDGVTVLDGGANIGTHAVSMARAMTGWGEVIAVEPQERLYYALCGNIALNNTFNAWAVHAALAATDGSIQVPCIDYQAPASYGSLELREHPVANQHIGQRVNYKDTEEVMQRSVDSLGLQRLDLMKIDVEGMELEVLEGARQTIGDHLPILVVEVLKQSEDEVKKVLSSFGYEYGPLGRNMIAIHESDPVIHQIRRR